MLNDRKWGAAARGDPSTTTVGDTYFIHSSSGSRFDGFPTRELEKVSMCGKKGGGMWFGFECRNKGGAKDAKETGKTRRCWPDTHH